MTGGEKLRQEGQRRALLRLLRRKFGPLPPDAQGRVAAADEATLDLWTDRVLTATSLDEVWA